MTPHSPLHVAAAQIASIPLDLDANLRKHLAAIDTARAAGVDVLVFPELSLTGHGGGAQAARVAVQATHPIVTMLAEAAGPMLTVFGGIERGTDARFYNAAFSVHDGAVIHIHRKVNLATYGKLVDGLYFAAGDRVETFAVPCASVSPGLPGSRRGWHANVLICADTWNPPLVHLAAAQGATLLLVPVSSALEAVGDGFDNPAGWDVNLRFHALTYGMPIVMANRVGREDGLTFWGGSRIVDATGHTLAGAPGAHDGTQADALIQARVHPADVHRARERLPTIRDGNLPLLARELERIAHVPGGHRHEDK